MWPLDLLFLIYWGTYSTSSFEYLFLKEPNSLLPSFYISFLIYYGFKFVQMIIMILKGQEGAPISSKFINHKKVENNI